MRPMLPLLLLVAACGNSGSEGSPQAHEEPFTLAPVGSSEDPEDVTCGVHCEPGSIRECIGEPGVETCAPSGMGWSACGYEEFPRAESICAKGTKCVHRPSGDPSLCEKECKENDTAQACDDCRQVKVYGGLMGCRATCKVDPEGACEPNEKGEARELVRCEVATPSRAAVAGCVAGPEDKSYCCPGGSAILNPLLRCPGKRSHPQNISLSGL